MTVAKLNFEYSRVEYGIFLSGAIGLPSDLSFFVWPLPVLNFHHPLVGPVPCSKSESQLFPGMVAIRHSWPQANLRPA